MTGLQQLAAFVLLLSATQSATALTSSATATPDGDPIEPLSQVAFSATLSLKAMRSKLRVAATAAFKHAPGAAKTYSKDGVSVTVTPRVMAHQLGLSAKPDGGLLLSLPINIGVKTAISFPASMGVHAHGCKKTQYKLSAEFLPRIGSEKGFSYRLGKVIANNAAYKCSIRVNLFNEELKNIATQIRSTLTALGRGAFKARLGDFNNALPAEAALLGLLRQPAEFGGAITLGIDTPRLRFTGTSSKGDDYEVKGVIEGRPRLLFGDNWVARPGEPGEVAAGAGFRLPARLLFPTNKALLPDASMHKASGCLGNFRLHPVPQRRDLAVLQRCGRETGSNVIWLSGANEKRPGKVRTFDRSMSNVLDEIVAWLDDPALWRGVDGISQLRHEVHAFRALLKAFQENTTIPLTGRGNLQFSELNMDLARVWVNSDAILADVILTGKAQLKIELAI